MTGFVLILAALQLSVPVRCYQTPEAWQAETAGAPSNVDAYYWPDRYQAGPAYIALSPEACAGVRAATDHGAFVLGHELAHRWQDLNALPFDEEEADEAGRAGMRVWRARLRWLFGWRWRGPSVQVPA